MLPVDKYDTGREKSAAKLALGIYDESNDQWKG